MTLRQSGVAAEEVALLDAMGLSLAGMLSRGGAPRDKMPYFADLSFRAGQRQKKRPPPNGESYTPGRTELCPGHDPKAFFFGSVLGTAFAAGSAPPTPTSFANCFFVLVSPARMPRRRAIVRLSSRRRPRYDALFTPVSASCVLIRHHHS
jgi:hypothetical protein